MSQIYDTHEKLRNFDFTKLSISKPTLISGGNYFIRFKKDNIPLYLQTSACYTRNGFTKNGRKYYTDLLFTNDDDYIIQWFEKLEEYCIQYIYENRDKWFDGDMEKPDIENYFTPTLKIYKSGKFYSVRTNIPTALDRPTIKIYDESENVVDFGSINDTTLLMNVLEIQGIKCSARSFQIEIEIKQSLVVRPQELPIFDKCVIQSVKHLPSTHTPELGTESTQEPELGTDSTQELELELDTDSTQETETFHSMTTNAHDTLYDDNNIATLDSMEEIGTNTILSENNHTSNNLGHFTKTNTNCENTIEPVTNIDIKKKEDTIKINTDNPENNTNMEEFQLTLEELSTDDKVVLKEPTEVYYKMYRDARQKAKMARELALSSYLEAKNIKNTYLLNNIDDSDTSDLDNGTDSLNSDNDSI